MSCNLYGTWFNGSLVPALAKVGYNPQYVFNEDKSGMFIDFDTETLKVYVLRGTKTCAKRRGYARRHVTLVACVRKVRNWFAPKITSFK